MPISFTLWNATETIEIFCDLEVNIIKVANIDSSVYLLTVNNDIYHGILTGNNRQLQLVKHEHLKVRDIDSCGTTLYIVDLDGKVFKYDRYIELMEEIVLMDESRTCCHGYNTIKFKMKVEKVSVGEFGALFVTETGQLWASGVMPQIGLSSVLPKCVGFFDSRLVYDAKIGQDVAVVIVSKHIVKSDDASDSDACCDDVLVTNCPRCACTLSHPCLSSADTDTSSTSATSNVTSSITDTSETTEKLQERNIIIRNTEAARLFLTRQLSWMSSAGEEYLAECTEKPTRIIKENVTNMASFVYEGVKTVGDKVATLSRHVSNSSDNCDILELTEDFALPRVTSKDDFLWSLSQTTSERESFEMGIREGCNSVIKNGSNLLSCEVWTWGNVAHGQLGIGDSIKRHHPTIISKLSNIGAQKASIQGLHAGVLTLDGRAYLWGRNNHNQVTLDNTIDQSSPRLFSTGNDERVCDLACGMYQTAVVTSDSSLYYMGKAPTKIDKSIIKLYTRIENNDNSDISILSNNNNNNNSTNLRNELLASSEFIVLNTNCRNYYKEFIIDEQRFLEEMLHINTNLIKALAKKDSTDLQSLAESYSEFLYFTVSNVQSLLEFTNNLISESNIAIFKYCDEYIYLYKKYLGAINDVISLGAFNYISKLVDSSSILYKSKETFKKEEIIYYSLTLPLERLKLLPKLVARNFPKQKEFNKKLIHLSEEQQQKQMEAERTNEFWSNSSKVVEILRTASRRLVRESHTYSLLLQNAGHFSSHWFILFNDVFVHVNGSVPHVHNLKTIWLEISTNDNLTHTQICLKMPEDVLVLCSNEPENKSEWLKAIQNAIKAVLNALNANNPPVDRNAEYLFCKAGFYKDARYKGRWSNAKMHGSGRLEWADGRIYTGQFCNNQISGFGRMEIPDVGVYEGLWKDNQQNGFGILKYKNGDIYKGCFKDGFPHGHGSLKQGNFMASAASIYIGEFVLGNKNGYGIIDDIVTGEKYLGTWLENKKHGNGLVVTSDGIYYEGNFNQDIFTGHGLMILEDGTHYQGDFKGTGNLNGKGVLMLNSGHTIEGNLTGSLVDGIKISNGILNLTKLHNPGTCVHPNSFGELCTPVEHKWKALFKQCYQMLGIIDGNSKNNIKPPDCQKIWQNIAVFISSSHQSTLKNNKGERISDNSIHKLDTIPKFGRTKMDPYDYQDVKQYLFMAWDCPHHPLGMLLLDLTVAYTTTYGGLHAHPLLLTHAVSELHSIVKRLYDIIKLLFPALPAYDKELLLEDDVISYQNLLYPIILPKINSPLFILYTLHNKMLDLQYWKRLTEWNKHSDFTLMAFLSVDKKFLGTCIVTSSVKEETFLEAIETLQLLKTTFLPLEKLFIIRQTFEKMTEVVQGYLGPNYKWSMDDLFPAFLYVVVRARILQLGSEIHFMEDFMQPYLENGELGIMFTTLKACYQQILLEKTSIS